MLKIANYFNQLNFSLLYLVAFSNKNDNFKFLKFDLNYPVYVQF